MELTREQRIEAHSLADSMDRDDMAYEIVGLRAEVEKLTALFLDLDSISWAAAQTPRELLLRSKIQEAAIEAAQAGEGDK